MNWLWFVVSIVIAPIIIEVVGYFWHRSVEHNAVLGHSIQQNHIKHHQRDYPVGKLRPNIDRYLSKIDQGWYYLGFIMALATLLIVPRPYSLVMIVSGVIYARVVINYLHSRFHVRNHWLANTKFFKHIQHLHDIHHWAPYNYGILFYFMDKIFGTYSETLPKHKIVNFK